MNTITREPVQAQEVNTADVIVDVALSGKTRRWLVMDTATVYNSYGNRKAHVLLHDAETGWEEERYYTPKTQVWIEPR